MRNALKGAGFEITEVHRSVWDDIDDKSQLSKRGWARRAWRLFSSYPKLVVRYIHAGPHDVVVIPYMGHLDVLVIWPFAKLRRVPVVWDAFISVYDTVVRDRQLIRAFNPLALALYCWEWLACRAASRVVLDTRAHAEMFQDLYCLDDKRTSAVFVGAEADAFARVAGSPREKSLPLRVLFYGQFIPLHGVDTIVKAARLARDMPIEWHFVGDGQEAPKIRAMLAAAPLPKLRWTSWVPYEELKQAIAEADVCLGIFGKSGKAARVIPNKVFQILVAGKPLVTRDSLAIRELVDEGSAGISLVQPGDAGALLAALTEIGDHPELPSLAPHFALERLARDWRTIIVGVQRG
ncbi:glycosyltransferase [Qipengyuania sp. CAU 1752]